jgi:YbbR domain-containing protein
LINRKLLERITEKWPVKVLSVAAALVISVFYRMHTLESRSFSVPLRVETNNTLVPASSFPQVIRISLRGEANNISTIAEEDIEAYIDLGRYTNEGSYRIPVKIQKRGSALGVEPLEISVEPAEILIKLENRISRSVNVYPIFHGAVAEGFELIDEYIIPDSIIAEGPRSRMESLIEFNTTIVNLDERDENFSVMVNIINNDPFIIIRGNRMIEYQGIIRMITRSAGYEPQVNIITTYDETEPETGDYSQ